MAKFNIHAGHNPDGKTACGAVGIIKESTEARRVKEYLIDILSRYGNTVYDCTCDNGKSQGDVLVRIVTKCNNHDVDLDVSIHFNSGANDRKGNSRTTGVEVLVYSMDKSNKALPYAERVVNEIAALGFRNRGVNQNAGLYYLRKTKAPAILIECCFVDDKDDCRLYDAYEMAHAIAKGILGIEPQKEITPINRSSSKTDIKKLQKALNKIDVGLDKLVVDGIYGAKTRAYLLAVWKKWGWNKDGKSTGWTAGQKTIKKLGL